MGDAVNDLLDNLTDAMRAREDSCHGLSRPHERDRAITQWHDAVSAIHAALTREPLPTGTAGVTVTEDDEKITMTVGPVTEAEAVAALKRHGWAEQAFHFGSFRYRSLVAVQRGTAALTRTGEDA